MHQPSLIRLPDNFSPMERIRGYRLLLALLVLSLITLTSTGDQLWSRETGGGVDDVSTEEQLFETAADQSADDGGQGDEDAQGDEDPESSGGAAPESTRMPFDVDPTGMGGRLLPNPKLIIAVAAALVAVGIVTTLAGGLLVSEGVRTGLLLALVPMVPYLAVLAPQMESAASVLPPDGFTALPIDALWGSSQQPQVRLQPLPQALVQKAKA